MPCAQSSDRPDDSSSPRQMRAWRIMGNGSMGAWEHGNWEPGGVAYRLAHGVLAPTSETYDTRYALSYAVWSPAALMLWLETKQVDVWFRQVCCSCRFSGIPEVVQVQSRSPWSSVESMCTEARFETRCNVVRHGIPSVGTVGDRSWNLGSGIWNLESGI